jgi:hypothetical protein
VRVLGAAVEDRSEAEPGKCDTGSLRHRWHGRDTWGRWSPRCRWNPRGRCDCGRHWHSLWFQVRLGRADPAGLHNHERADLPGVPVDDEIAEPEAHQHVGVACFHAFRPVGHAGVSTDFDRPDTDTDTDTDTDIDADRLVAGRVGPVVVRVVVVRVVVVRVVVVRAVVVRAVASRAVACRRPEVVESVLPALVVRRKMAGLVAPGFPSLASPPELSRRTAHR